MTKPDIAGEAEALIRALRGVTRARIHASAAGIESIHVTATDDDAALHMAAHVRSALLAGLAAPVTPARIHVAVAAGNTAGLGAPASSTDHDNAPPPRDRLRLLHAEPAPAEDVDTDPEPVAPEPPVTARPRLVAVDCHRPGDGRVVCRVSVAYQTRVHRAEAVAVDLPGSAAQAAAQAAVRALAAGGLDGLELNGLREVEIAGRDYVLVALRRDDGPAVRHRSGSALMFGTPERSAAEAAVDAANALI